MSSAARAPYDSARYDLTTPVQRNETPVSAVSWAAVAAGAFVTGAMSITLMTLGAGIGLSSLSPWPNAGSASRLAPMAITWIILVQILASAIGGYLAGRLRTKWVALHNHEVYFRDTAHGFLAWAVGLVIAALFLSASAASIAGDRAATSNEPGVRANEYFVDSLFRTGHPEVTRNDSAIRTEAGLILSRAASQGLLPADRTYLVDLVAARTGMNKAEAQRRVDDTVAADLYVADTARKALAHSFYWLFVALLLGAFCASYAATIGGRQRDHIPAVT
jgi:MFS family permease